MLKTVQHAPPPLNPSHRNTAQFELSCRSWGVLSWCLCDLTVQPLGNDIVWACSSREHTHWCLESCYNPEYYIGRVKCVVESSHCVYTVYEVTRDRKHVHYLSRVCIYALGVLPILCHQTSILPCYEMWPRVFRMHQGPGVVAGCHIAFEKPRIVNHSRYIDSKLSDQQGKVHPDATTRLHSGF